MNNLRVQQFRRVFFVCSLFLLASLLLGCGSKKAVGSVRGKIVYNSVPVGGGTISFHPANGKAVKTFIEPDGGYTVDGIPPGDVTVVIETESAGEIIRKRANLPPMPKKELPKFDPSKAPPGMKPPEEQPEQAAIPMPTYVPIPARYGKVDTSPEKFKVVKGDQKKDFTLTEK